MAPAGTSETFSLETDLGEAEHLALGALAEASEDLRSRCQAHNLLGILETADGETDHALESLKQSRSLADQLGDEEMRVAVLNNLALAQRARGELDTRWHTSKRR